MKTSYMRMRVLLVAGILVALSLLPAPAPARERSLDKFLAAQGTFCFPDGEGGCWQNVPPLPNIAGWEDIARDRCALVDYAGLAARWLQDMSAGAISLRTAITGTVRERTLANGGAEIIVRLNLSDALMFSVAGCDLAEGPLEFGYRVQEILAGATPSLGDAEMVIKFAVVAPGLPLPDIIRIIFFPEVGEDIEVIRLDAEAHGALRPAFGVPDGTPGTLRVNYTLQTGPDGNLAARQRIHLSRD
jgi:hypothetical protein